MNKQEITPELLLKLISNDNKDLLYLLEKRDKENPNSEAFKSAQDLIQYETGEQLGLYALYRFVKGEISEEELVDRFYSSKPKNVVNLSPQLVTQDKKECPKNK